ncbi:YbaB/EbfC family nucleoid-associated protein [Nocardia pseudobrasiliensis]|uniref:YbaB/EbfC DNA-binding family protein n=1 Tax=Nocardia pseudobrasiliensis TaxID=45979 RepID=A0A370HXZ9_9NOCA|nr:YbaB/EbfC family nucleoid-associated protein [Nocardia pseudobrasiliensis]RDI63375.1 YbaB/EbfC DNA-binding family protein [Nocardia pseudobrasiliensis]
MSNERLKADAAMMMEALSEQMSGIAEIQRNRARLTATVTACDKRISVTVNADGILIDTKFADDIKDLSYEEIAAAMTHSVQAAAQKVQAMTIELMEPLRERKARLPRLSEMLEGAPDLGDMMPMTPRVSTAPPNSPERHYEEAAPVYEDVEDFRSRRSMINDTDR